MNATRIIALLGLSLAFSASAQEECEQKNKETFTVECRQAIANYTNQMRSKNYMLARKLWPTAFEACSCQDTAVYHNGIIIYNELMGQEEDEAQKKAYMDTVDQIYQKRFTAWESKYKNNEFHVEYAYWMYLNGVKDYDKILKEFSYQSEAHKDQMWYGYLVGYYISKFYKYWGASDEEKGQMLEGMIKDYFQMVDIVNGRLAAGAMTQAEVDNAIQNFDWVFNQVASLQAIQNRVRYLLDNEKLPTEKQARIEEINKYLDLLDQREGGATQEAADLLEELSKLDPTSNTFIRLYNYFNAKGETRKADDYLEKAIDSETDPEKKLEYRLVQLQKTYNRGSYKSAVSLAKGMLGTKHKCEAYKIIARSIAAMANKCGETTFERKANYWLAADYMEKAKDCGAASQSDVDALLEKAPSGEDVFEQGLKMGSSINCSCWGESTTIR